LSDLFNEIISSAIARTVNNIAGEEKDEVNTDCTIE
jgi:hypothetical protein